MLTRVFVRLESLMSDRAGLFGTLERDSAVFADSLCVHPGSVVGVVLREADGAFRHMDQESFAGYLKPLVWAQWLAIPSRIIVRHLLTALAAPLVLIAVVQALMQAQIPKGNGVKLIGLLLLNTTVAILIGLRWPTRWRPENGSPSKLRISRAK